MTHFELIEALTRWELAMRQAREHELRVLDPLELYPESPLHQIVWTLAGEITRLTAELVGDDAGWLDWYVSENGLGDLRQSAGPAGQERPIGTLEDLAWVIRATGGGA